MPDQSTASTEHALIQEISAPLATLPDDPVPDVADVEFPIALRGYDRLAVDAYVKRTAQLVAELQATRSPESAVRRALGRVGEEVSGILQRAHETAEQITAQSRIDAENRLEAARQEAAQITADAHRRLKELDAETDRIWAERHRIVEDARDLASQLLGLAESATERFPAADEVEEETTPGPFDGEISDEQPEEFDQEAPVDETPSTPQPNGFPDDGEQTVVLPPIDFEHQPGEGGGPEQGLGADPPSEGFGAEPVPGEQPPSEGFGEQPPSEHQ